MEARFSALVQTCPGAHPASCTMGTGSFPGAKQPGRGADRPTHHQCRGLKKGTAIPLPTLRALVAYKGGTFTFNSADVITGGGAEIVVPSDLHQEHSSYFTENRVDAQLLLRPQFIRHGEHSKNMYPL